LDKNANQIAVLCPDFFGYPEQIKVALTKLGYNVSLYDERPSNRARHKILLRLGFTVLLRKSIEEHYDNILEMLVSRPVDILLLIDTEAISRDIVLKIKNRINCKVVLYMWDSVKNKPGFLKYIDLCDKAFTFDPLDAKNIDELKFLPLFYASEYSKSVDVSQKYIDVSFVGTLHSDRYRVLKSIEKQISSEGLVVSKHIYIQNKFFYFLRRILNISLWESHFEEFTTLKLTTDEVADIFRSSKVVIDINHPGQIGLTSRTFEALKSGAKLITTNSAVADYPFYDSSMISIIDRNNIHVDKSFLQADLRPVDMGDYSLEKWLDSILHTI